LDGKAINLSTEMDAGKLERSDAFKRLACGETLRVRPIYGEGYEMTTHCKLWFVTNNAPYFAHGTDAEMRRLRTISFRNKVAEQDSLLPNKIALEHPGVLLYMVEGLRLLMGQTSMPQGGVKSLELLERYSSKSNPVATFVGDCCDIDPVLVISMRDLYSAFADFAIASGVGERSAQFFHSALQANYPDIEKSRKRIGAERTYVYLGIGLKPGL
jgi:phage/plasmid-associated DNA primase